MLQPLQFAVQTTRDESLPGKDTARLLNMYPERGENGVTLRSVPGLTQTKDVGPGQVEALLSSPDGIYVVVGGSLKLWNVNDDTLTVLGGVPQGDATMARSRSQLGLVAGNRYYVWDGTTLAEVTSTPFTLENSVACISNYFIITESLGQAFYYSLDADTIDGLAFASAEYYPDNLVRVMVANDLIWFMGTRSVEPWQVTGAALLPFSKVSGAIIEKGLRSTLEAVVVDNVIHWVSQEGRVYRGRGENITTDAIAAALEGDTGRMVVYQTRNHDNAVVRLSERPAVVFDPASQTWWERSTGPTHQPWEVTATVQHNGTWYAGTQSGHLCTFSGWQDRGEELRREVVSANITQAGNRFTVDELNLRVSGSGSVMLSWSVDGGRTFSNERQRAFGGKYEYPIQINRPAANCRQFCLKIACTDNTDFAIHGAGIQIS